jgi:APA family basic amino acid/polyamine antiporter
MMGLGSIVGTGVFVSIGIAAGVAGPSVVLAVVLAALLAGCNALSSAQLAASHPVSGGTYEYGYKYLSPALGFTAGWMFLCAKSASAATAALGFSGYLLHAAGQDQDLLRWVALAAVAVLTALVHGGLRRSNAANIVIVSLTLLSLAAFVVAGIPSLSQVGLSHFEPFLRSAPGKPWSGWTNLLQATALMFVAYTGYGRIATLGEEVTEPRTTIPTAIVATLLTSVVLYGAVTVVAVGTIGSEALQQATAGEVAPLEVVASHFHLPQTRWVVALGAVTAMLGVLLNLIIGLSRVVLAMGRRGDLPQRLGQLDKNGTSPRAAVTFTGLLIVGLTLLGSVKAAWSFSAFTVLVYYAITNLAALRLKGDSRLYPRLVSWCGLAGCLLLAFWVEPPYWIAGLSVLTLGLLWHGLRRWTA